MDGLSSMSTQAVSPVSATLRATPDGPDGIHNGVNRQANATEISTPTIPSPGLPQTQADSPPDMALKPSVTIPHMNRMNSQSSTITPSSTTSSRRNSRHSSVSNLIPTRPAPSSPISNPSSRRVSRTLSTPSSTHSTQRSPSHKNSTSSIRKSFANDATGTEGALKVSSSRRQSTLVISFTPASVDGTQETAESPEEVQPPNPLPEPLARKILDPLSAIGGKVESEDTPLRRNFSSTSASTSGASTTSSSSNPVLRHANELEAAYGIAPSTHVPTRSVRSGSSASGTHTPLFSTRPRSIIQSMWGNRTRTMLEDAATNQHADADADANGDADPRSLHESVSKLPPPKDESEAELTNVDWAKAHPILVQDFGFEHGDSRFDTVPIEALLSVLRPLLPLPNPAAASSARRGGGRGFPGRGPHYGGAAQYGGRWGGDNDWEDDDFDDGRDVDGLDDEEDDGDDGWGFPMGTVSGGPAPLGTTLLGSKRSRRELRNRSRAWGGLGGSKGVGGKLLNEESSEAESSGFYDEDVAGDSAEDDVYGFETQNTPLRAYHTFVDEESEYTHVHPLPLRASDEHGHVEVDGVDADDDEGDSTDYEDAAQNRHEEDVKPGIYSVLFSFDAESPAEMSIAEGQTIRILGRGGDGWAVALRSWSFENYVEPVSLDGEPLGTKEDDHGLVPLAYLEVFKLDGDVAL